MGKVGSKLTQALGFGDKNPEEDINSSPPGPPQWDTTIDELFGDAPPTENVRDIPSGLEEPMRPRKRRKPPPIPPQMSHRSRRRPSPSLPSSRRRNRRAAPHAMRTPVIPDIPRKVATGKIHAINAPFGVNRLPMVLPTPMHERQMPTRIARTASFKRRCSSRRRRPSSQRHQRLQELLQCPVCLAPYIEPRLLPCGHTYCNECLNRLIENDNNDVVICPECRKQHLVPDDGVFPPNFVVRNLLEEQGMPTSSRLITPGNLSLNGAATAKCTTCETFAPLRLCRHCNFMVCDRCLHRHRNGSNDLNEFRKKSKISNDKVIQFYVAVRKITRSNSQVKRLTIDMPIGNYLRDTCETLIRRIADREQLQTVINQLVLEFGDKRLRHQRTLASYGVQNGDLLFLFNPDQRLSFLAYEDEENSSIRPPSQTRENSRLRSSSHNSSISDIRTTTSNDFSYNRAHRPLSTISDNDNYSSSSHSDN